jgi:hypothetical protein
MLSAVDWMKYRESRFSVLYFRIVEYLETGPLPIVIGSSIVKLAMGKSCEDATNLPERNAIPASPLAKSLLSKLGQALQWPTLVIQKSVRICQQQRCQPPCAGGCSVRRAK